MLALGWCPEPQARVKIRTSHQNPWPSREYRKETVLEEEEANALFRTTLNNSTASLKLLSRRLGSAVEKARPYYEAREAARRTQLDCHWAAVQFQRASVLHQNARETIRLAEERFLPRQSDADQPPPPSPQYQFDSAWQELLNHATMKLLEAEQLKHASESEHLRRANTFAKAQAKLKHLERSLERSVARARPYFEQREVVQQELLRQKATIQQLQRTLGAAKSRYSSSLRELESISEQIHERRRMRELKPDLVSMDLGAAELDAGIELDGESATSDYQEDFRLSQEQQYWADVREQIEAMSAGMYAGRGAAAPAGPQAPLAEPPSAALRRRRTLSEPGGGQLGSGGERRRPPSAGW
ncbi:SH3 domain-binding protein 5 [Amphibalanus amphitrite]|uniref:SH3 domain-binding protein 5 n=1 Tax=Amphibalanus amphitrite TaxID=1232801 RepID=A0A6A4W635_AMPAM|nr:SH3 domain-binding protein 5 [Amphibalanus amphitrite]